MTATKTFHLLLDVCTDDGRVSGSILQNEFRGWSDAWKVHMELR